MNFVHNIANKTNLIPLPARFFRSTEGRRLLDIPLLSTEEEKLWKVTCTESISWNHEEADTRLVLHACRSEIDVVVVAKDTDVLVLLVHAYAIIRPCTRWYMKIDHEKFVDIGKIYDFLGENISELLPHVHAITGCDTTSFFFGGGKVRIFKKFIRNPAALDY